MDNHSIDNCSIESVNCQDDMLKTELLKRFKPKKILGKHLADSYKRLGDKKRAERVKHCGDWLEFKVPTVPDCEGKGVPTGLPCGKLSEPAHTGALKPTLYHANFCRERLCPMCAFRRSLKIFGQVSQIMNKIGSDYEYIFLTLTVRNCSGDELKETISRMQKAWKQRFTDRAKFKKAVKGYFKVLEVTHNLKRFSKSYDTYHPHFHCILAVDKHYFKDKRYIKQAEWLEMWREAYKDPLISQVDVRRVKAKEEIEQGEECVKALSSAVAEVTKYTVKSSDYIGKLDEDGNLIKLYCNKVIDSTVETLGNALKHRRLVEFGGIFKEVQQQLQLDDCEDGDLIHVNGEELRSDVAYMIYKYRWSVALGQYELYAKELPESAIMFDPETGEIIE